jgi:glycosyltransferase involved in cell wall biosynthesis
VELPTISIVTPCLNAAATIGEALESVRRQRYPRLEHLVVDGASTDGTLELLAEAEAIRYVSEPDDGRAAAVNKGVAMTSGEVLGFLNADDRYEPGALRAVGEALARCPPATWATGYCRIVNGRGREIRRPITAYKNALLRHFSFPLYLTQNFVSDPATFVRRGALEEAGQLDGRYRISHDYDLWLRIARRHDPVVLEQYLAFFRMTEGTLSMAGFERQFREHAECARSHGKGHPLPVAVNRVASRGIVAVYKALRAARRLRSS